ncbi:MAG: hypothetical protein U5N58_06050 [Actinomycetota bacterium]|nr:hypothetical protein [Actinomycetota bacterium]
MPPDISSLACGLLNSLLMPRTGEKRSFSFSSLYFSPVVPVKKV